MRDNQSQRLYLANFSLTVAAVGTQPPLPPPLHQPSPGLLLCLLSFPLSPISSLSSLPISLSSSLSSPFLFSLFSFYLSLFLFSFYFLFSLLILFLLFLLFSLSSSLSPLFSCLPPLPPPPSPYSPAFSSPSSPLSPFSRTTPPPLPHLPPRNPPPFPPLPYPSMPPPLNPPPQPLRTTLPALQNNKRVPIINTRIKHYYTHSSGIWHTFLTMPLPLRGKLGRKDWSWAVGCGMWDVELKLLPIDHGSWSLERMEVRRLGQGLVGIALGLWGCWGCCEYCKVCCEKAEFGRSVMGIRASSG